MTAPRSRRTANLLPVPSPTPLRPALRRNRTRRASERPQPAPAVDWSSIDSPDLSAPALYINRELSWLEFNHRVLAQAQDAYHPLLERVKFLAITASNLDEFFMVRVATILKKYRADIDDMSIDGLNTEQELVAIRQRALDQMDMQSTCWSNSLRPLLASEGIHFI
jgi:polyphosphate kinase